MWNVWSDIYWSNEYKMRYKENIPVLTNIPSMPVFWAPPTSSLASCSSKCQNTGFIVTLKSTIFILITLMHRTHVSDHHRFLGAAVQIPQRFQKKSFFWFAHNSGLSVSGIFQSCHKWSWSQRQAVFPFVVTGFMDGNERGTIQN